MSAISIFFTSSSMKQNQVQCYALSPWFVQVFSCQQLHFRSKHDTNAVVLHCRDIQCSDQKVESLFEFCLWLALFEIPGKVPTWPLHFTFLLRLNWSFRCLHTQKCDSSIFPTFSEPTGHGHLGCRFPDFFSSSKNSAIYLHLLSLLSPKHVQEASIHLCTGMQIISHPAEREITIFQR